MGDHPILTQTFDTFEDYYWHYYNEAYKWSHNWHSCNLMCKAYIGADIVVLIGHIAINLITLEAWADGAFFLVINTYYTFYMTFLSVMLLLGSPPMMMAPYKMRRLVFIFSTITVSFFVGNCISIMFGFLLGKTPTDSFAEIMNMYLLMLQFGAFVPSLFIFLFDGLALSPFSIFSEQYGNWDDTLLPGQIERPEDDDRLLL